MNHTSEPTQSRPKWLLLTMIVIAMVVVMIGSEFVSFLEFRPPWLGAPKLQHVAVQALLPWLPWLLLAPLIGVAASRFRFRPRSWRKPLIAHILVGTVAVGVAIGFDALVTPHLCPTCDELYQENPEFIEAMDEHNAAWTQHLEEEFGAAVAAELENPSFAIEFPGDEFVVGESIRVPLFVTSIIARVLTWAVLTAITCGIVIFFEQRQREAVAERLRRDLVESELSALRMQINPHFLFNTLNSIQTLMADDVPRSRDMLDHLGELLQATFRDARAHELPLRTEVSLLERYMAIQIIRFGDRIAFSVHAQSDTLDVMVPSLCLQPLVENALAHGPGSRVAGGRIDVTAMRHHNQLVINVDDDGPGKAIDLKSTRPSGLGLANTRSRLQRLYGDDASMDISDSPLGGVRIQLSLPLRRDDA